MSTISGKLFRHQNNPPTPKMRALRSSGAGVLTALSIAVARADVFINEFMANNPGRPDDPNAQLDMDGSSPAWIELHNTGAAAVDLTGWSLSDDPAVPGKWVFAGPVAPATTPTTIAAGGYKLVFCGGLPRNIANVEPHTTLGIDTSGQILLGQPNGMGGWTMSARSGRRRCRIRSSAGGVSYGYPANDKTQAPVFFESDTPGASNPAAGIVDFCKDTTFDIDRGFYDAPFTLHITTLTPGATIAYTVNGTQPTAANGTQVAAPDPATPPTATINIAGTTIIRARVWKTGLGMSDIDTQTYLFATQVLTQTGPLPSMGLTSVDTYSMGHIGRQPAHTRRSRLGGRNRRHAISERHESTDGGRSQEPPAWYRWSPHGAKPSVQTHGPGLCDDPGRQSRILHGA